MTRWEYLSVELPALDSIDALNKLGAEGWLLCVVTDRVAWFARDHDAARLEEQAERHAEERGGS